MYSLHNDVPISFGGKKEIYHKWDFWYIIPPVGDAQTINFEINPVEMDIIIL